MIKKILWWFLKTFIFGCLYGLFIGGYMLLFMGIDNSKFAYTLELFGFVLSLHLYAEIYKKYS